VFGIKSLFCLILKNGKLCDVVALPDFETKVCCLEKPAPPPAYPPALKMLAPKGVVRR